MTVSVPHASRLPKGAKVAKDFQEHLASLEQRGVVVGGDRPINKDTELHPLARWQFQGALSEDKRRAFIFTHVVGSDGKRFDMPVVVGGLASWREFYAPGGGIAPQDSGPAGLGATANPTPPVSVTNAACQEVV